MNTPIDNNSSHELSALANKSYSSESSASPQSGFNDNIDNVDNKLDSVDSTTDRIKHLELELARVKLELVDAQCKNQEFDHIIKGYESSDSIHRMTRSSIDQSVEPHMSASGISLNKNDNSSNGSFNLSAGIQQPNNGSNSWLSKTFTQFKEAKNQVVQKAQKVKIPSSSELNFS